MINEEKILKILQSPHVSEKASVIADKYHTVIFKVVKNATKKEIQYAVQKLFTVQVKRVCTVIIKGKLKRHKKYSGYRNDWKKAYVILKKGQNLDFINKKEKYLKELI